MTYHCRRVDVNLTAVEHVDLTVSLPGCVFSLEGTQLETFTVDDLEAMVLFEDHGSHIGDGNPFAFILSRGVDIALLTDADPQQILEAARDMKIRRAGKSPKFVVYWLPSFDDFILTSMTCGSLRWQPEQTRTLLEFPHSRLDFLKFHSNRSVMAKLSAFRDRSIELSADAVSISGSQLIDELETGSGTIQDLQQVCCDAVEAILQGKQTRLHEIATRHPPMLNDMVVIMSDNALYVTERTGSLKCRLEFKDMTHAIVVNKRGSDNAPPALFLVLSASVIWLHSKFALDMMNRMLDLPTCNHLRGHTHVEAPPRSSSVSDLLAQPVVVDVGYSSPPMTRTESKPCQTEAFMTTSGASDGPTVTVLRIRNQELEEELRSQRMALETLKRRPPGAAEQHHTKDRNKVGTPRNSDKQRDADESALRFYATILEAELDRVRDLDVEGRLRALENAFEGQDEDPRALKYALSEANRRELIATAKVSEIRTQMQHFQSALQAVSEQLRSVVDTQMEAITAESRADREQMLNRAASHKWTDLIAHISDVEKRVQQEVGVRTASLSATIVSLNDELKKREHQVTMLAEELDRFFTDAGDNTAGAACLAALKKIVDRSNAVSEYHAAVANRTGVEAKVRAMVRQVEDMQAAREAFIFETESMLSSPNLLSSATELERLRRENAVLRQLQYIPGIVIELADLRVIAEESTKHKSEALESKALLRTAVEKARAAESTNQNLRRELATAKTIIANLEKEAMKHSKRVEEVSAESLRTSERLRREIAELRKQLKVKLDAHVRRAEDTRRSASRSQTRTAVSPMQTPEVREPPVEDELHEAPRVPPIELESPVPNALFALRMEKDRMQRKLSEQRDRAASLDRTEHIEVMVETPTPKSFGVVEAVDLDPIALTKQRFEQMKNRLFSLQSGKR